MGVSLLCQTFSEALHLPTPGFEGFEKRLEVEFISSSTAPNPCSLREISREEIVEILNAAACSIVSELSNDHFDSYVLSESSLFVYPFKFILKTCGTTKILQAIPKLLDASSKLCLKMIKCKYTRGNFLFPEAQPFPYGNFGEEVRILEKYCGRLGLKGKAYVMGDVAKAHNWHIYVAASDEAPLKDVPIYTLEVCMTQLDRSAASKFYKTAGHETPLDMTSASGIQELLPNFQICDFAFDPCGYSMNGMEGNAHSTIHVTPEEGFSYASFELMGYGPDKIDLHALLDRVTSCFKPSVMSLAVHISHGHGSKLGARPWEVPVCPSEYTCDGSSSQELPGGSTVVYHTYNKERVCSLKNRPPSFGTRAMKLTYEDILEKFSQKGEMNLIPEPFQLLGV